MEGLAGRLRADGRDVVHVGIHGIFGISRERRPALDDLERVHGPGGTFAHLLTLRDVDMDEDVRDSGSIRRPVARSEEHTSELQSLMRISYAVFCLKKKKL